MNDSVSGTVSLNNGIGALSGGSWDTDQKVYTVPFSGLNYSTTYKVSIEGFKDTAGNVMTVDASHGFTTMAEPLKPFVSPAASLFVKDIPRNVTVTVKGDGTLSAIRNGAATLTKDTDYTISKDTVTLKKEYLQTLTEGSATIIFDYGLLANNPEFDLWIYEKNPVACLTIGDSIASGYGLAGYKPSSALLKQPHSDAYASLVGESVKLSTNGITFDGLTSANLIMIIGLPERVNMLREYLSYAEIITLSIGSNDVLGPFLGLVSTKLGCTVDEISAKLVELYSNPAEWNRLLAELNADDGTGLKNNTDITAGVSDAVANLGVIISFIRQSAPNARLYVTNAYNPYLGIKLPYNTGIDMDYLNLSEIADGYIRELNRVFSRSSADYTLIDSYFTFAAAMESGTSPINMNLTTMNFDPHPNILGHSLIADLIVSDYNGSNTKPIVSDVSLAVKKGATTSFTVSLGQGAPAATVADVTIANSGIASISTSRLTTSGTITVTGLAAGTTNIIVSFNDLENTVVNIAITVKSYSSNTYNGNTYSGNSRASSSGTTKLENQLDDPVTVEINIDATAAQNGHATVDFSERVIAEAMKRASAEANSQGKAKSDINISVTVNTPANTSSLTLGLSQSVLKQLVETKVQQFVLNGQILTISLNQEAIRQLLSQSTGDVTITIKPVIVAGIRNSYEIVFTTVKDGKTVTITSLGDGSATISIPCKPANNEAIGYFYAVYVDTKGKHKRIPGSAYDTNSRSMLFNTNHFSIYGVGYTAPSAVYTDISTHWAKESIDYVVGRGLLTGISETEFSPNTAISRAMLVTALGRLAGIDEKVYTTSSFTDMKADSPLSPYIEWAYKKGIINGIGNNLFAPDQAVTREEIAVIFVNYIEAIGYTLPVTRKTANYTDVFSIGNYYKTEVTAMQQAGIMMGSMDNKFNPKSNVTRSEVCAMLHRYIKLMINPATAQGWAINDVGQYLYYKVGEALIGTQIIDGVKYFFNTDGILKTGWVKDGDNLRFYTGNTMQVGWYDIGTNNNKKTYYFNKEGLMVSGRWFQIDSKWYYFYADGSLARNTKIGSYEVDKNGVRKAKSR